MENLNTYAPTSPAIFGQVATMSSREIAELVESRHDSVKRTVERLSEKGVIGQPPLVDHLHTDAQGKERTTSVYRLEKRDSFVVVAQLSPEFTARLVDRWQELEARASGKAVPARRPDLRVSQAREIRLQTKEFTKLAKEMGLEGNQMVLSVSQGVEAMTGVNPMNVMGITHLDAPQQEALLSASDVGARMEGLSGNKINKLLIANNLQTQHRNSKGKLYYELTEKGRAAGGVMQDVGKSSGGVPIRQLRWASGVVDLLSSIEGATQ